MTDTPLAIVAFDDAFATIRANAAATLIGPPDVDALGVPVVPDPLPPFAVAVLLARSRSRPT